MPTFDEAMALVGDLTTEEIRAFMAGRLPARDAETFAVFTENVSHEVLVFASARTLTRMGEPGRLRPECRAARG